MNETFYHGSFEPLDIGCHLRPGGRSGGTDELDRLFEEARPGGCLPRSGSVFMCVNEDDIDACGGYTEHVYEVEPAGPVERSDLAWYTQAQIHLEDGDAEAARNCALAYWDGLPFPDEESSVFEYRAAGAVVRRCLDAGCGPGMR